MSRLAGQLHIENETGEFCGPCFVQWGAIAVPAGAGVGALIGLLIDATRR